MDNDWHTHQGNAVQVTLGSLVSLACVPAELLLLPVLRAVLVGAAQLAFVMIYVTGGWFMAWATLVGALGVLAVLGLTALAIAPGVIIGWRAHQQAATLRESDSDIGMLSLSAPVLLIGSAFAIDCFVIWQTIHQIRSGW